MRIKCVVQVWLLVGLFQKTWQSSETFPSIGTAVTQRSPAVLAIKGVLSKKQAILLQKDFQSCIKSQWQMRCKTLKEKKKKKIANSSESVLKVCKETQGYNSLPELDYDSARVTLYSNNIYFMLLADGKLCLQPGWKRFSHMLNLFSLEKPS